MNKLHAALFPLTFLSVTHSISALVVAAGVLRRPELAAEIVIVQGAAIAAFHAFSGNARNLILTENGRIAAQRIVGARFLLLPALVLLAMVLSTFNATAGFLLAALLVLRRASEWLAEVHLCVVELDRDRRTAAAFLGVQAALFVTAAAVLVADWAVWPFALGAWAISPLLLSAPFLVRALPVRIRDFRETFGHLAPHLGSTLVIGFTLYVLRLVVLSVTDKATTGLLFTAVAMGSFLGTMYATVLGPSMALYGRGMHFSALPRWVKTSLAAVALAGFAMAALAFLGPPKSAETRFFGAAIGFSLVGGVIMLSAQQVRLRLLLNGEGQHAFGADVLAHVLLVLLIAVSPIVGGTALVSAGYLANAVLCWLAYWSAERGLRHRGAPTESGTALSVIAFLTFLPLFFMISGRVYRSDDAWYDSGGSISTLPLPLALVVVFPAIFVLARYRNAARPLGWIAVFFMTIMLASIAASGPGATLPKAKLLLLIQCLLPTFGLALGVMFAACGGGRDELARGLLWVLAFVVPVQLVESWLQGSLSLLHHVLFFDVYQHLQYVPTVLAGAYLVVLGTRWESERGRALLFVLGIAIAVYVVGTYALLGVAFLASGVVLLSLRELRFTGSWALPGLAAGVIAASAFYGYATSGTEIYLDKYGGMPERTALACVTGPVARASVLVRETEGGCIVRGEPRVLSAPIIRTQAFAASGEDTFRAEGVLRAGRIAIGLRQDDAWVEQREVDAPGPFIVSLRPARGTYQGAIFNADNRSRFIDLSISRVEWIRADPQPIPDPDGGAGPDVASPQAAGTERVPGPDTAREPASSAERRDWWDQLPTNWRVRFEDWFMYARRVAAEPRVALVGAPAPLDRSVRTSAHNYYIDFLYNFGLVGLSAVLLLIGYTLARIWRCRGMIWSDRALFALCVAVVFCALVDSVFKVTLRQPYSGLTAFFLWGILLHRLGDRRTHVQPARTEEACTAGTG